jgi:hypothetical protein
MDVIEHFLPNRTSWKLSNVDNLASNVSIPCTKIGGGVDHGTFDIVSQDGKTEVFDYNGLAVSAGLSISFPVNMKTSLKTLLPSQLYKGPDIKGELTAKDLTGYFVLITGSAGTAVSGSLSVVFFGVPFLADMLDTFYGWMTGPLTRTLSGATILMHSSAMASFAGADMDMTLVGANAGCTRGFLIHRYTI